MSKTKKELPEHINLINELNRALGKIGWSIAIPDSELVDHLIIGKVEAVQNVVAELPAEYDIMVKERTQ